MCGCGALQFPHLSVTVLCVDSPVLLTRAGVVTPEPGVATAMVGLAWVALDPHCALHYQLAIAGVHPPNETSGFTVVLVTADNMDSQMRLDNLTSLTV